MAFSDIVQSISSKVLPEKRGTLPLQPSTTGVGIASGGHVPFEDDVRLSLYFCSSGPSLRALFKIWTTSMRVIASTGLCHGGHTPQVQVPISRYVITMFIFNSNQPRCPCKQRQTAFWSSCYLSPSFGLYGYGFIFYETRC